MKKLKLTAVLLCAAMLLLTACSSNEAATLDEAQPEEIAAEIEEPEPAEKIVGSRAFRQSVTYVSVISLEELVETAASYLGRIVIGTVDSVAYTRTEFTRELDEYDVEAGICSPPTVIVTGYNIAVRETLLGEESDTLLLVVLGSLDCGVTKPNVGDTLLLFLWSDEDWENGEYGLIQWEDAMFRINDDGTLYSFSDAEFTARFDGLPLDALTSEIDTAIERLARGEVVSAWERVAAEFAARVAAERAMTE
jgi:hypothetical protein